MKHFHNNIEYNYRCGLNWNSGALPLAIDVGRSVGAAVVYKKGFSVLNHIFFGSIFANILQPSVLTASPLRILVSLRLAFFGCLFNSLLLISAYLLLFLACVCIAYETLRFCASVLRCEAVWDIRYQHVP